ncbi:hypothetical protein RBB78_08385 [Tunturiibacter empetritectus]|uniref:hypothetical protein n=1 Tax=Tunturiibacter empetritectus TaxID=3069691 RepID=UPI003D9B9AF1
MRSLVLALLAISALGLVSFQAASARQPQDHLASNMVLIIRHSEKPETGNGLTAQGEERAHLYVKYFQPFQDQLPPIEIDSLYAGADSKSSIRPTLTLEPLSKAISLPINSSISSKDSTALVAELRSHPHGHSPSSPGVTARCPRSSPPSEHRQTNSCPTAGGPTTSTIGS